jgi:glutathione synthase
MITIGMIIDPIETLQVETDTSLLVIGESNRRQHRVLIATLDDLFVKDNQAWALWQEIGYRSSDENPADTVGEEYISAPMSDCDVILMRQDPPFDLPYLAATYILDYAHTRVINSPISLRNANEKMFALRFPQFIPTSFVSRDVDEIFKTVQQKTGQWVLKPLNRKGGEGIFRVTKDYPSTPDIINIATHNGNDFIIVQEFLPAVYQGDKRIFLLEGKPVGWINRIPPKGDFRANIQLGATTQPFDLTDRDNEIIQVVGKALVEIDAPIACLDVIDGHLSEVNITSPTGAIAINQAMGIQLEKTLVDYLEAQASKKS